jgi:N-methylhydantoinase A
VRRIGIDVGGTFTDVVVVDEDSGATSWFKALTDYHQPANGIMNAFLRAGVPGRQVSHLQLGTTLGLNAILTRSGAVTGLLTTRGFRDVLEIRRTHRNRLFDIYETVPEPLVSRDLRMEVDERIDAHGNVIRPLDEEGVRQAWRRLRDQGVRSLAICFLFSFENPSHEARAREIVLDEGGVEDVFISSDVLPVFREYERTSTTVIAAYVAPVVRGYVQELSRRLGDHGVPAGRLSVMTNSGGLMSADAAASSPVPTLLSGPAGGVAAARWLAREVGISNLLTLDMGGTSCDVSGIQAGVPDEKLDMDIEGLDVAYPTFDIHTIGAGGGSVAWIDDGGALQVGPRSAGSSPGPACYGAGGQEPTVTDANLVLGRYDERTPLGGTLQLDVHAARRVIEEQIAEPLGLSVERAAAGILRIVNAHMVNAVKTISVELGRDTRDYALAAFGGAGPVHAADIASELSIPRVLIPPFPGCTSAFGAVMSSPRRDAVQSVNTLVPELRIEDLRRTTSDLFNQVVNELVQEGHRADDVELELWMNLHYKGQAHDLAVRHESVELTKQSIETVVGRFHGLHEQAYGHYFEDVPVEVVTVRAKGVVVEGDAKVWLDWKAASSGDVQLRSSRQVYFESIDDFVETRILERPTIRTDEPVIGPAIILQTDTTVVVPPGHIAIAHETGSLLMSSERRAR